MNTQDIISSQQSVGDRLSIRRLPHALTRWTAHKTHGFRLAMYFGDRCWLRPTRVGAQLDVATAGCWLQHIPMLPDYFHMTLFDEVADGERCLVTIGEDGCGGFRVSVDEDGRVVLESHWYWSLTQGVVVHGLIRAHKRREDRTLPGRLLRNSFELYYWLDVQEVTLTAGYEKGGYVWAKFGFMPESQTTWNELAQKLRNRLSKIKNKMDDTGYDYVINKLKSDDPRAIWAISDLNQRVGTVKLGYQLLAGTTWKGTISLQDRLAIDRFKLYLTHKKLRTLSW